MEGRMRAADAGAGAICCSLIASVSLSDRVRTTTVAGGMLSCVESTIALTMISFTPSQKKHSQQTASVV